MKVLILSTRSGGPLSWSKRFKKYCDENTDVEVVYKSDLFSLLIAPFYVGDCDIVHSMIPLPFKFWKQPFVLNIRGDYKKEISLRNPFALLYPLSKKIASNIIVQSNFLAKKINLKKPIIIPNAIDQNRLKIKKTYDVDKKIKLVLVTSFDFKEKAKGVISLNKSLKLLPKNISYSLDVYGSGVYFDWVKNQINNKQISFKGKDMNIQNKLFKYDIFTYYSNLDNFPNAVVEAMAVGLPIISNDVGAISEMISNDVDGYVVNSTSSFTTQLTKLISSEKLRENFGKAAQKKVKKYFSWDVVAKNYINTYKGVLNAS